MIIVIISCLILYGGWPYFFSDSICFKIFLIFGLFSWEPKCSSLEAVNKIYEIKGRKHTSPLAICVGDVSEIKRFADTEHLPNGLLDSLLPGPVTVVLQRGLFLISVTLLKKKLKGLKGPRHLLNRNVLVLM